MTTRSRRMTRAIRHSNPVAAYLMPDFQNPTGRSMSAEHPRARARRRRPPGHRRHRRRDHGRARHRPRHLVPAARRLRPGGHGRLGRQDGVGRHARRAGSAPTGRSSAACSRCARRATSARPSSSSSSCARLLERMDDILDLRREQLRAGRDRLEGLLADAFPDWQRAARRRRHRDVGRPRRAR